MTYEVLPAVFDPELARSPGAPVLHPELAGSDQPDDELPADVTRNLVASLHDGVGGDVDRALAESDVTVGGEWRTQRVSHAQLETHGSLGWLDDDGRLVIRTSSQVPFLTRRTLCRLLDLPEEEVRVFTKRVGGGFGGKQEMFAEDLVALVVLRTGRPAMYEMSRPEEFQRTSVSPPVPGQGRPRRRAERQAHRDQAGRARRHGCLRKPRAGRALPRLRRVDQPVQRPGEAGRRGIGVHQQHPVRGLPRIRPRPGDPRRRVRNGRTRAGPRHRPLRAAAHQRGPQR
nr:molybdopterin cofactor-binding domain-containing protein [Saccharopolyspora elongata]